MHNPLRNDDDAKKRDLDIYIPFKQMAEKKSFTNPTQGRATDQRYYASRGR